MNTIAENRHQLGVTTEWGYSRCETGAAALAAPPNVRPLRAYLQQLTSVPTCDAGKLYD